MQGVPKHYLIQPLDWATAALACLQQGGSEIADVFYAIGHVASVKLHGAGAPPSAAAKPRLTFSSHRLLCALNSDRDLSKQEAK
jgi:hypothetical protein